MKRKGISPLIAAVLLIAFTMAVASLFAQWAPQLIKSAQGDTRNKSEQIQKCSTIIVSVIEGNETSVTVQQTSGETAIGNMTATWFYETGNPVQRYLNIETTRGTDTESHSSAGTNLEKIKVTPLECKGAAPATYTP